VLNNEWEDSDADVPERMTRPMIRPEQCPLIKIPAMWTKQRREGMHPDRATLSIFGKFCCDIVLGQRHRKSRGAVVECMLGGG
jgi:hypothetical protein